MKLCLLEEVLFVSTVALGCIRRYRYDFDGIRSVCPRVTREEDRAVKTAAESSLNNLTVDTFRMVFKWEAEGFAADWTPLVQRVTFLLWMQEAGIFKHWLPPQLATEYRRELRGTE